MDIGILLIKALEWAPEIQSRWLTQECLTGDQWRSNDREGLLHGQNSGAR
ncbi:hypothetical protein [Pseudomonas sp. S60]|nr:hypothetical protein [Pseudomonas sp. S60]